ncbi:hypothetical protein [Sphingomonas faeni]|uniref:hypothetical protein n=1 Tax=Sphingomonas faeni TaxID=185950 RepID=UPI0027D84EC6|nr:hypothetical protein [Sphingomonas faeni]
MAVYHGPEGFTAADVNLPDHANLNDSDMEVFADVLLGRLDEMRAEVLVLGGNVAGRPWQAILHLRAGAASFV